jgi:hypothetical protein
LKITDNAIGFELGCKEVIGGKFAFFEEGFQVLEKLLDWDFQFSFYILQIGQHGSSLALVENYIKNGVLLVKFWTV